MPRTRTYRITIPAATRYLTAVRRFVAIHAREAGFSEAEIDRIRLAVDEACTNAIKHAYKGNERGLIDVIIRVTPEKFHIIVRDRGPGFNPSDYQAPDIRRSVRHRKGGGYGIHLMYSLMDEVYFRRKKRLNEVHLIKYRRPDTSRTSTRAHT